MPPTIFRSTDAGAPRLDGTLGSLQAVLDGCLVNGYGALATGTLISDNSNPSDGDTVTIAGRVFTFKTNLDQQGGPDQVKIGANADATLTNLAKAVNLTGVYMGDYTSIVNSIEVYAAANPSAAHTLTFTARFSGTAGNAITTTASSSHLTWGAATLTGGAVTKSGLGWSKEFTSVIAPQYISTNYTGTSSASASLTLNINTGRAGDLCLLFVSFYDSASATTVCNTPAGWTLLHSSPAFSTRTNGDRAFVFYKYLTAADVGANIVLTPSGGNAQFGAGWSLYRYVEPGSVPTITGQTIATGITPQAPVATAPAGMYEIQAFAFSTYSSTPTASVPTGLQGMDVQWYNQTSQQYCFGAHGVGPSNPAGGSVGPFSFPFLGNLSGSYGVTMLLKPQSGAKTTAVYRVPSGASSRPYLRIEEMNSLQTLAQNTNAGTQGYESMTDAYTGTNPFAASGTSSYVGGGLAKSATTDLTPRPWLLAGDGRTFYLFV